LFLYKEKKLSHVCSGNNYLMFVIEGTIIQFLISYKYKFLKKIQYK